MRFIEIYDLFKTAWIWQVTNIKPISNPSDSSHQKIFFTFPDTEEIRSAIRSFLSDENGIKSFCERYKVVRAEMFLLKGQNDDKLEA